MNNRRYNGYIQGGNYTIKKQGLTFFEKTVLDFKKG